MECRDETCLAAVFLSCSGNRSNRWQPCTHLFCSVVQIGHMRLQEMMKRDRAGSLGNIEATRPRRQTSPWQQPRRRWICRESRPFKLALPVRPIGSKHWSPAPRKRLSPHKQPRGATTPLAYLLNGARSDPTEGHRASGSLHHRRCPWRGLIALKPPSR